MLFSRFLKIFLVIFLSKNLSPPQKKNLKNCDFIIPWGSCTCIYTIWGCFNTGLSLSDQLFLKKFSLPSYLKIRPPLHCVPIISLSGQMIYLKIKYIYSYVNIPTAIVAPFILCPGTMIWPT